MYKVLMELKAMGLDEEVCLADAKELAAVTNQSIPQALRAIKNATIAYATPTWEQEFLIKYNRKLHGG